jgi:D-lactate dehydrogenase (cytochrome)
MVSQYCQCLLRLSLNSTNDCAPQTAVLPNGEVIKTRRRARKSAAGFDITKLFIGAEGTLGVVTEGKVGSACSFQMLTFFQHIATLRLAPVIPTKVAMAQFPDVEHAVNAVQEILSTPYGPHIRKSPSKLS